MQIQVVNVVSKPTDIRPTRSYLCPDDEVVRVLIDLGYCVVERTEIPLEVLVLRKGKVETVAITRYVGPWPINVRAREVKQLESKGIKVN